MTLKTDSSVNATGFEATVEVVNISLSALDCGDFHCVSDGVCIPHSRVCNRVAECGSESDQEHCAGPTHLDKVVFVDSVYNFTSPNFPGEYPNNLTAIWHFSTFEGFQLLLKFQVLVTESCCDIVTVGNGNSTDRQVALHWSGGPPESEVQFLSSGNTLWMTLKTDSSVSATGFEATIEVVNISLSALDCGDFHCVSDGVCIPHSRVCNRVAECGSESDQEHCAGWNTEEPGI
ncbi:Enteropeptidase [Holothuria leucospilota]|uniref:Enteropeptidase n=1 Tax=Holothuria leucospilota TaxID=206669 RepID=A0A9Q0YHS0_HOLLE|nr:Enteropeptidase [Holothuria leucospilota]